MTLPSMRPSEPDLVDDALVVDGAHAHGYLLTTPGPGPTASPDVAGWRRLDALLPGLVLHLHPRTVVGSTRGATGTVVLLGHPVDVAAGITDATRIASRLSSTWDLQEDDGLVHEAASLGGRWTLLARRHPGRDGSAPALPRTRAGSDLLVVPDAHATQPVFYATGDGGLALGSTPALVARSLDLPVDEDAVALLEELRQRRKGAVTYLPGLRTAYRSLMPLVPNCLLRIDLEPARVEHRRFWPVEERVERTDVDAVYDAFRDRLAAHLRLLTSLGRPVVSLTAGVDSRVTAALAHEQVRDRGGFAFTYVNPRDARKGAAAMADVTGASAVAAQLGLPHRVIRWRQPPDGGTFDVLHRRTCAPLVPSRGAAHAMWADLPADVVQLQSNGGETGTAFVRQRTSEPLSPLRLARIMMHATSGLEDLAERMYAGYLEHAEMTPERLLGHDHHDVFYWEQRMGRWGWQKFLDGDLGHRALAPFNDRVLLETMLSLPLEQRLDRTLLERVLTDVRAARLPRGHVGGPSISRAATTLLPGAVRRRVTPVVDRQARRAVVSRLAFPLGYAVLPVGAPGGHVPVRWARVAMPERAFGRAGVVLRHHPTLTTALVADGSAWILVLGKPVWVRQEMDGPRVVAGALHDILTGRGSIDAGLVSGGREALDAVVTVAAQLSGRHVVLAGDGDRTVVVPDPLTALGVHLLEDGSGVVSHPGLATGPVRPLDPTQWLSTEARRLEVFPLSDAVDLAAIAQPQRVEDPATRAERLARHTRILRHRGPAWLGLTGGAASGELLGHLVASGGSALTWWDRRAGDDEADEVFAASARAQAAGVQHLVLGLREDVDGGDDETGRRNRAAAAEALRITWGTDANAVVPVSVAVDRALPRDAVVWLGSSSEAADLHLADRPWELLQGVRRVALPFSDRLLPHLP